MCVAVHTVDAPHTAAKPGGHETVDPSRAGENINQTEASYVAEKSIYEVFWELDHIPGAVAKKKSITQVKCTEKGELKNQFILFNFYPNRLNFICICCGIRIFFL